MKSFLILFVSMLVCSITNAQELDHYQSATLFKKQDVKLRRWYKGQGRELYATSYYDKDGRLYKFQIIEDAGATEKSTYYFYNNEGKLENVVDTIKNNLPLAKNIQRIQRFAANAKKSKKYAKKPTIKIGRYDIVYSGDELVSQTKYNPNGTKELTTKYQYNGRIQDSEWYTDGKIIKKTTSKYIDDFNRDKFSGWYINNKGEESKWEYRFEYEFENGVIKKITRIEGAVTKEILQYFYDTAGLLTRKTGNSPEYFEYEFY